MLSRKKIYVLITSIIFSSWISLLADVNQTSNPSESVPTNLSPSKIEPDRESERKMESRYRHLVLSAIFGIYGAILNFGRSSDSDNVKTTKVSSEFIGKSYILKAPYFIQLNLPKGRRAHSASVYVADGEFVNFENPCGNCLDSKRLEKPIRLHYIPQGSKITVVDAFVIGYNFFKTNSDNVYLIIQDETGLQAEITTLAFRVDVLMEKGTNFDYHVSLLKLIKQIEDNSYVNQIVCAEESRGEKRLIHLNPFKYSTGVERKIYRFIKDFNLNDQLEISNFSTAQNSYDYLSCSQIKFKTINSISLYFYYAMDWGLSNNTYEIENYPKIQNSPFVTVNHSDFIKMNDADILKTYP